MEASILRFTSKEQGRLIMGLFFWGFTDVLASAALYSVFSGESMGALLLYIPVLLFMLWAFLPSWVSLRPKGFYGKMAYLLTTAINLALIVSFTWAMITETTFTLTFVAWGIALALLALRIPVGVLSRREQKRSSEYKKRRQPKTFYS